MLTRSAFIFLVFSLPLFAQAQLEDDVYRCSNNIFQNAPCPPSARKPVANKQPISKQPISADADCQQEGDLAESIIDRREVGRTVDDIIAMPPTGASGDFIRKVYSLKGSSYQANSTVARECMRQKAKSRSTNKKLNQPQKLTPPAAKPKADVPTSMPTVVPAPQPSPAPVTKPAPAPVAAPIVEPAPVPVAPPVVEPPPSAPIAEPANSQETKQEAPQNQQDPQGICSSLQTGLDNVAKQRKRGAGSEADFNRQQKELEKVMKDSGC